MGCFPPEALIHPSQAVGRSDMRVPLPLWSCLSFPSWCQLLSGEDALSFSPSPRDSQPFTLWGAPFDTMGCPPVHLQPLLPPEAGGWDQGMSQQWCPLLPVLGAAGTGLTDLFVYLWLLQALLGVKTIPGPPEGDKIWPQGNTRASLSTVQ